MAMAEQPGFFDVDERYAALPASTDRLTSASAAASLSPFVAAISRSASPTSATSTRPRAVIAASQSASQSVSISTP